jgi:hypothetical protein
LFPILADVARKTKVKSARSESRDKVNIKNPKFPTNNFHFGIFFGFACYFFPAALSTPRYEKECLDEKSAVFGSHKRQGSRGQVAAMPLAAVLRCN